MTGTYIEMRLSDLIENPDNPRETLADIDELAGSIAAVGVLQRLLVTPTDSFQYMVVDGHRRFAALRLLEWDRPIPVEVRTMDRVERLTAAVSAGSFSRPISPIDQARAFAALKELGLTQVEISERTGVPQPTVSVRLRLLELTDEQQTAVHEGRMTLDAAKKATYELGRRALDRAPRSPRAMQLGSTALPTTTIGTDACPTCGQTKPTADDSTPAVRTVVPLVLMCDDCDYETTPDRASELNRHCHEVHNRRASQVERTPVPAHGSAA